MPLLVGGLAVKGLPPTDRIARRREIERPRAPKLVNQPLLHLRPERINADAFHRVLEPRILAHRPIAPVALTVTTFSPTSIA